MRQLIATYRLSFALLVNEPIARNISFLIAAPKENGNSFSFSSRHVKRTKKTGGSNQNWGFVVYSCDVILFCILDRVCRANSTGVVLNPLASFWIQWTQYFDLQSLSTLASSTVLLITNNRCSHVIYFCIRSAWFPPAPMPQPLPLPKGYLSCGAA